MRKYFKDENDLQGGVKVKYRNKIYITGNRYHDHVELYNDDNELKYIARIKSVYMED